MGRRRATATDDEQEPRRHPTTISRPTTTPDDKDKQITGTTQGKAAGDSENATSHRPQEPRPSKQGREDEPERRTHGKQRERRKSRRQPTPSTRRQRATSMRGTAQPHPTPRHGKQQATATEANPDRDANRTSPPHLSNKRGAERYDDRAKRIASRHDRGTEGKPAREARGKQGRTRRRPHEKPRDNGRRTTTPRPACRKNGAKDETRTSQPGYPIRSHRSSGREPSRPIHHPHRAVFASSPQTARGTR